MNNQLSLLLDKVYEMEGLIHLCLKREEKPEGLLNLILKKGKEIGETSKSLYKNKDFTEVEVKMEMPMIHDDIFTLEEYALEDGPTKESTLSFKNSNSDLSLSDPSNVKPSRGKLVFSINEKFRFKRELFGNSDADFNNTLALVASMDDYQEAEEYFLYELGFDKSFLPVKDFLDVLKRYFK